MSADVDLPELHQASPDEPDETEQLRNTTDLQVTAPSPLLHRWIAAACMVAGLILGVVLASSFGIGSDIRSSGGTLFAQGALGEALSRDLSGDGSAIGPSFWSKDGVFCRVFRRRAANAGGLVGIACRDAGAWRIRVVAQADSAGVAAAPERDLSAPVRNVMDNMIVGVPLDRAAEEQAQKQGWRAR